MNFGKKPQKWWRNRFVTLMVIPERTRRVHRLVVPFFLVKLGAILFSLALVFLVIIGMDYINVLRGMAENKRLKGENFKLRREIQLIQNKVDAMDATVERVRNYAKKLQLLTGQSTSEEPKDSSEEPARIQRRPAVTKGKKSGFLDNQLIPELPAAPVFRDNLPLGEHVENVMKISVATEFELNQVQVFLLAQSALLAATPSLLPANGFISSSFGYRRHPYDSSYKLHAGVDIVAEMGTPIRSPAEGVVIFSGYKSGYGNVIVIDHGYSILTLFAHNSTHYVTQGTRVKRGQIIGETGNTGKSTGPHLHYEVRKHGRPVNPVTFFSRARF